MMVNDKDASTPQPDRDIAPRHVVVTGGSRGIGKEIVKAFASNGDSVSYCSRNPDPSPPSSSYGTRFATCDVTDGYDVAKFMDEAVEAFGPVDVLVNNAGITRDGAFALMSRESWDTVLDTSLGGVYEFSKLVTMSMMRRRSGVIVNISSLAGIMGNRGQANYSAAKGAINSLTLTLAKELGPSGVRVNAIAPGFIETDMTADLPDDAVKTAKSSIPLRRFGTTDDVASLVFFLCSEQAAYITGQIIRVDGGMTL